ncbi:NCS1 nucleoside transporter family [Calocera cornea HHB12733]|uniref:NCS1 nucleoside transporter family n=1 Tax=Calocera cornea HHB12733 TaxID=1353952 RepID=A0A165J6Z2_9BASI|nr:NCS1 nucleoside transporter family [Calocera cornea HHB12733]
MHMARKPPFLTRAFWELTPEPSSFAPRSRWSNSDMDPTPPEKRTWTTFNYITYWISDAFNVATWDMASALLASGLSWRQALPCIVVGHTIIAAAITANGTIGARLHIPFPVLNRSSFGFWFSYFSVVSRLVLAMFWFAIQTYTGSECVYQMLKAIWPSFARLPNRLPAGANITSAQLLSYFLYWLIQLPFLLIPAHRIRWLFLVKSVAVTITGVSMMVWAFVVTGGAGAIFGQGASVSGSRLAWAWLSGLNSVLGNYATLSVNIPDFTRLAQHPRHQYIQLLVIPLSFTFIAFQGIVVTSAGYILYGAYYWDPLRLIDNWDNRAAAFFASLAFCLATLGTNIGANSISAANDFTALAPRWLNIRRGQILCALIGGWVIIPWEILATASGFLNFMGGYTVFLGPICAIMIVDYWFVKHQKIDVPALYNPHGRYHYIAGINWRAALALLVSVPPNLPGLINAINPAIEVGGGVYPYDIAWLLGFTLAGITYYASSVLFPARETLIKHAVDVDEAAAAALAKQERQRERDDEEAKEGEAGVAVREV